MIQKPVAILLVCMVASCLIGCRANSTVTASSETVQEETTAEVQEPVKSASQEEEFLQNFDAEYPDYELLEYVPGDEGNAPIRFAAVAREKGSEIASTLFVVDENGTGKLGLASGLQAVYRSEDGLKLDENSVRVSLDVYDETAGEWKIHDFQIVVMQEIVNERYQTKYTSMEEIRS